MNDNKIANAGINSLLPSSQTDFETIEIAVADFQNILSDLAATYNQVSEMLQKAGVLCGRDLARMAVKAQDSLKAAESPVEKILLWNMHFRKLLASTRNALLEQPQAREVVRQAITKIQLRAEALIGHIKILAEGKEKVALDSPHARAYLAGLEGQPVSRRDCIRALHRAERICPALECGHVGGRAVTRLTATARDLLSVSLGNGAARIG
jgi:hypothetical protein